MRHLFRFLLMFAFAVLAGCGDKLSDELPNDDPVATPENPDNDQKDDDGQHQDDDENNDKKDEEDSKKDEEDNKQDEEDQSSYPPMPEVDIPNNQIHYTAIDNRSISPVSNATFGLIDIVRNVYANGKGIIEFSGDVTSIGADAFSNENRLSSITLPNSVVSIEQNAFMSCHNLETVTIGTALGSALETIDASAFGDCPKLSTFYSTLATRDWHGIVIDNRLVTVAPATVDIVIPNGVTTIGQYAFYKCENIDVTIPASVETLEKDAFYECKVANMTMRGRVTPEMTPNLPDEIETLTIGGSEASIEKEAFYGCTKRINNIVIADGVDNIPNSAFAKLESIKTATISDDVQTMGTNVFNNCPNLTKVKLPSGLTTIKQNTFSYCTRLSEIQLPESVTSIEYNAFISCSSLAYIQLPENLTTIDRYAFKDCINLCDIILPETLSSIGMEAFSGCTSLTSITIPESVTEIGFSAFGQCNKMSAVYGKFTTEDNRCIVIDGDIVFFAPAGISSYTIPAGITKINNRAFHSNTLNSITIGNDIEDIQDSAFSGCDRLISVVIGDNVKTIGYRAFYYTNLQKITIGSGLEYIGEGAFEQCRVLYSVTIPGNIKTIGKNAFAYCVELTEVTIEEGVENIEERAFIGMIAKTITLPSTIKSIGKEAFQGGSTRIADLYDVYCKATTPPQIEKSVFFYYISGNSLSDKNRHIYVPSESLDAYKSATNWSTYSSHFVAYDFD